ncbi:MAG: SCP2 sterol-binding domain-containing protein [Candidatus Bathyarchaeaceae archaeon]
MVLYPSKKWLEEYRKALNQSKEYKEAGKGWGVGWNGDFIFQIENIPVDKISIKDLPADAAKELKEYIINGTSYSYIQLKDGECLGARPLKDPKEVQVGFIMKGPYENWKKLTKGQLDPTRALLARQFTLVGDMAKVMRYTRAANLMTKISSSIKTEFIDEVYAKK